MEVVTIGQLLNMSPDTTATDRHSRDRPGGVRAAASTGTPSKAVARSSMRASIQAVAKIPEPPAMSEESPFGDTGDAVAPPAGGMSQGLGDHGLADPDGAVQDDGLAGVHEAQEGLAIGQTEAEAQRRYGGRLTVTPHAYTGGGPYLTLVPPDPAEASLRIVAETGGSVVTSIPGGASPRWSSRSCS